MTDDGDATDTGTGRVTLPGVLAEGSEGPPAPPGHGAATDSSAVEMGGDPPSGALHRRGASRTALNAEEGKVEEGIDGSPGEEVLEELKGALHRLRPLLLPFADPVTGKYPTCDGWAMVASHVLYLVGLACSAILCFGVWGLAGGDGQARPWRAVAPTICIAGTMVAHIWQDWFWRRRMPAVLRAMLQATALCDERKDASLMDIHSIARALTVEDVGAVRHSLQPLRLSLGAFVGAYAVAIVFALLFHVFVSVEGSNAVLVYWGADLEWKAWIYTFTWFYMLLAVATAAGPPATVLVTALAAAPSKRLGRMLDEIIGPLLEAPDTSIGLTTAAKRALYRTFAQVRRTGTAMDKSLSGLLVMLLALNSASFVAAVGTCIMFAPRFNPQFVVFMVVMPLGNPQVLRAPLYVTNCTYSAICKLSDFRGKAGALEKWTLLHDLNDLCRVISTENDQHVVRVKNVPMTMRLILSITSGLVAVAWLGGAPLLNTLIETDAV